MAKRKPKNGKRRGPIYVTIRVERPHCPRCDSTNVERTRTRGRFVEGLIVRHMRCRDPKCGIPFILYIQTVRPETRNTLPKREHFGDSQGNNSP